MSHRSLRFLLPALAVLQAATPTGAQTPRLEMVPKGMLGVRFGGSFLAFDSRLGLEPAESGFGAPLGGSLRPELFPVVDTIGERLDAFLSRAGSPLRASRDDLTPGTLRTRLSADLRRIPIALEAGLSRRLTLGLVVPIERRATEPISARVLDPALGPNLHPDSLARRLQNAGPQFHGLSDLPYLPLAGSRLGDEIQRLYTGATGDTAALPLPGRGLSGPELDALLRRSGHSSLPLASTGGLYQLGDAELYARLLLVGAGARASSGTGARVIAEIRGRVPTATGVGLDSPQAIVTDAGHGGLSASLLAEASPSTRIVVGAFASHRRRFVAGRDRLTRPVAPPFGPLEGPVRVRRSPGAATELALLPTLRLSSKISLRGAVGHLHVGETRYATEGTIPGSRILAGLEVGSSMAMQTVGLGARYSTIRGYLEGESAWPVDVAVDYARAISGTGGAPDYGVVRLEIRVLRPVLRPREPPAAPEPVEPEIPAG